MKIIWRISKTKEQISNNLLILKHKNIFHWSDMYSELPETW